MNCYIAMPCKDRPPHQLVYRIATKRICLDGKLQNELHDTWWLLMILSPTVISFNAVTSGSRSRACLSSGLGPHPEAVSTCTNAEYTHRIRAYPSLLIAA